MTTAERNYLLLQEIEANRKFILMAYQQNPKLLESAEARIRQLFGLPAQHGHDETKPMRTTKQSGISLIELIMFIVIVSVALAGILLVMNQTTRHSADPLVHKQAMAAAESLLEEIELQDFINQNDGSTACLPASAVTPANRASEYHIVDCYNGFNMTGITDINNVSIGLDNYNANVAIDSTTSPLGTIAAGSAVRITVTVTDPLNNQVAIDGYRAKY